MMNFLGAVDAKGEWYAYPVPFKVKEVFEFYMIEGRVTVVAFPLSRDSSRKTYPDLETALIAVKMRV